MVVLELYTGKHQPVLLASSLLTMFYSICFFLSVEQIAVTYGQEELRERCQEYIEAHTEEVFRSDRFKELSEDTLALLLQSDELTMDELDILASVREWATVNAVRVFHAPKVIA